jgi:hypothetical protein
MREKVPDTLEKGRVTTGPWASRPELGFNGFFRAQTPKGAWLLMMISDGMGWEHVSIEVEIPMPGIKQRDPTWEEMCWVKYLVWREDEVVVQYHPAEDQYVNIHPHVLHLWRPIKQKILTPPLILV